MPSALSELAVRRTELLAQLAAVDRELAQLTASRSDSTSDDEHDPEGSTLSTDWSRISGLRTTLTSQLDEITRAETRVASGTYGVCVDCGRAIPAARLAARPAADRCVACAAQARS